MWYTFLTIVQKPRVPIRTHTYHIQDESYLNEYNAVGHYVCNNCGNHWTYIQIC